MKIGRFPNKEKQRKCKHDWEYLDDMGSMRATIDGIEYSEWYQCKKCYKTAGKIQVQERLL